MTFLKPIKPMEPVLRETPFSNPDYIYQIKWDGVRMLTYLQQDDFQLINRKLHKRTERYPELAVLKEQVYAKSAILDGEIIAFGSEGRPRFSRVLKRDLVSHPEKIRIAVKQIPVMYVVFDVLYVDGSWVVNRPLIERQELLSRIVAPSSTVQICDNHEDGVILFQQMKELDMEGILMKERTGSYHIGEKHKTWYKVKYFRRMDTVIGGITLKGGVVNALLLGAYQGDQLVFIGGAGSGLTNEHMQLLTHSISSLQQDRSPFQNPPKLPKGSYQWFTPVLTAEIEFMEWTEDITLRAPVIKSFGRVSPHECQISV